MARSEARGIRIPLPRDHWWVTEIREAANQRAERLGLRRPGLRSLLSELEKRGTRTDEVSLGRCVNGELVSWELALPLSSILGVPPPAAIARTIQEALVFQNADELNELLEKLRSLKQKI